jgi:hypothetical protein
VSEEDAFAERIRLALPYTALAKALSGAKARARKRSKKSRKAPEAQEPAKGYRWSKHELRRIKR